jgi:hypothetical protein
MDKSWIQLIHRGSRNYMDGVKKILNFAFMNPSDEGKIWCPCRKCVNRFRVSRNEAWDHIICDGFTRGYVKWVFHGEHYYGENIQTQDNPDIESTLGDQVLLEDMEEMISDMAGGHNDFNDLLEYSKHELYPGCKFSKLSAIVHLFHLKCLNGWSNKSFMDLLEFLIELLPKDNFLPKSYYEMKKTISKLGLGYEKIHACPNDCMLFRNESQESEVCMSKYFIYSLVSLKKLISL